MIGNILKVIAALIIGYLVGLLLGGMLGILIGLIPSLFIYEIVDANQSTVMSILLSAVLGGLLGYLEVRIFNRMFDANNKPLVGSLIGIPFGLIFGIFNYFVLDVSSSDTLSPGLNMVAMIYSGAVGSRIGSTIFSVFGALQTLREIVQFHKGAIKLN